MSARTKKPSPKSHTAISRHTIMLVAVFVVGMGLIGLAGWYLNRPAKTANTTSPSTKSSPSSTPATSGSASNKQYAATGNSAPSSTTTPPTSAPASSGTLAAPAGQLLNVQTVSLASDPSLRSICQTIANASCDIRLINGNVTKYVGARSTGANGVVIFDWSAKTVGLTTGQWSVQAVVTQNGATGVSHTEYLTVQQ